MGIIPESKVNVCFALHALILVIICYCLVSSLNNYGNGGCWLGLCNLKWVFPKSLRELFDHRRSSKCSQGKGSFIIHQFGTLAIGCLKWNVDASFDPIISRFAILRVLRNHMGHFVCLFSSPIPTMEINCAELLAIHRAIFIIWANDSFRNPKIVIKSSSANVVAWRNCSDGGPWNMGFQLNYIRGSCKSGLHIEITHKGRGSNAVVDALAKQGLPCSDNFVVWLLCYNFFFF